MKKVLFLLTLIMMMACGKQENKVVYIGTNAEFPPFEYLDKGEIKGFDIELIKEIAKVEGFEVKIEDMAFDGLIPALQTSKIDAIIAGMTATDERKKSVSFTKTYYTATQMIIVKEGNKITFDELKGKKVGVMLGFTGDIVVSDIKGVDIKRFDSADAAILDLKADKIDAVVLDSEPAKNFVAKNEGLELISDGAQTEEYAIAVRKNDEILEKLENGLKKIKENGTYDKLLKKYF